MENNNNRIHYSNNYKDTCNEEQNNDWFYTQPDLDQPPKRTNKKPSRSRTAARITSMALAFGLIAGSTFYGTNKVLNHMTGADTTMGTIAKSTDAESSQSLLSTQEFTPVSTSTATEEGSVAAVAATGLTSSVTISCTTVEQMQDLYQYFGGSGFPNLEDIFGGNMFRGGASGASYSDFSDSYSDSYGMNPEQVISSCGTGVLIGQSEDCLYIATNNHVVSGATTLSVGFVDETAISAEVLGTDPDNDLAVVSVKIADVPQDTLNQISIATIGDSSSLVLGEQVVAIGNALGYGQSVTSGVVSAFNRDLTLSGENGGTMTSTGLIQTDASINSGNSGGGLFNMKGELIAINEAKSSSSGSGASVDNIGFAIPMEKALPILQSMIDNAAI